MDVTEAADYLNAKATLHFRDRKSAEATKQFLDEKSFQPGLGELTPKRG
jgi:hypothetical protein